MQDANNITALEAWELLKTKPDAVIIDTRTFEEWKLIGTPKLTERVFRISSHMSPDMSANPSFLSELEKTIEEKTTPLLFICRTSGRSRIAASIAETNGYENCFVISDGFEGSSSGAGWLNSKLPYEII